jgi:hypothetical protein
LAISVAMTATAASESLSIDQCWPCFLVFFSTWVILRSRLVFDLHIDSEPPTRTPLFAMNQISG